MSHNSRRNVVFAASLFIALIISAPAAVAQVRNSNASVIYRLTPAASFEQGCFPPCLCPIHFLGAPRGTMTLTPLPSTSAAIFDYRVDDVNWIATTNSVEWRITGSGLLRRVGAPAIGAQRLELNLHIGDQPVEHFDSGWVLPTSNSPGIDLTVSINGGVCYDTVIRVAAAAVPANQQLHYRVLSGSTWQHGCFEPCACPISERPLAGSFTLIALPSSSTVPTTPIEYAVVNARFFVISPAVSVSNVLALQTYWGYGFYRRNLPSPAVFPPSAQRLSLDLRRTLASSLTRFERFDSGVVPTISAFPALDISISRNGMVCLDTVFNIEAAPLTPTTP